MEKACKYLVLCFTLQAGQRFGGKCQALGMTAGIARTFELMKGLTQEVEVFFPRIQ